MSENGKSIMKSIMLSEELENYFTNTIVPQLFVDSNFTLRKLTPPAMKQFTLTEDDLGKDIREIIENIKYSTLIENINEVIETGQILEKEIQTTDKRWFQMNILPYFVYKGNKANGVIITFVDITRRITALKELEKLNSEYYILMYSMAHDIKQPISVIALMAEELRKAYFNNDKELIGKLIDMLARSSDNMISLLSEFTGNIEKSATNILEQDEKINIELICQNVILSLRGKIYENQVTIRTEFNTTELIFPKNNLRSILYNLVENAIKYKKTNQPLEILIKTEKKGDYIELLVEDNGLGIAEAYHQDIFKKHMRIDYSVEGTGMGLYIISKMLEEKGGNISVRSRLSEGSNFIINFKIPVSIEDVALV